MQVLRTALRTRPSIHRLLWVFAYSIPFVVFAFLVCRYSINVPMHDEYDMILRFMNSFLEAGTAREKLGWLWRQQVESRVLTTKLQALLEYALFGAVNFKTMLLAGDFMRVGIAGLMAYEARKAGLRRAGLLAVSFIVLAPAASENLYSVNGQLHVWNALWGLLFIAALVQAGIWAACVTYIVGIYTLAGGLLLYPVGMAYLALRRRWRDLLAYGVVTTVFTAMYFYHYQGGPPLPRLLLVAPAQAVKSFAAFLGVGPYPYDVALIAGAVLAAVLVGVAVYPHGQRDFLSLTAIWLLLTSVMVALGRGGDELGVGFVPGRYAIYSQVSVAIGFVWAMSYIPANQLGSRLRVLGLVLSVAYFSLFMLVNWGGRRFEHEQDYKIAGINTFLRYHDPKLLVYPQPRQAGAILTTAQRLGVYQYAAAAVSVRHPVRWLVAMPSSTSTLRTLFESVPGYVSGWAFIPGLDSRDSRAHVLLSSGDRIADLDTFAVARPDVAAAFPGADYKYSGFECFVVAYDLPAGTYQLALEVQNPGHVAIVEQPRTLVVP